MKIKNEQLRKMNDDELNNKLFELKKDLIKVNAQIAAGTIPENPGNYYEGDFYYLTVFQ